MKKIKNIFFDYGRTVVGHPSDEAGIGIVKAFGDITDCDAVFVRNTVFSSELLSALDIGSISREDYKEIILKRLPKNLHAVALKTADYHISALPPLPGMEELLCELKTLGYKLFVTSNMDIEHASQMKDTPVAKYFDGMIFSGEIGVGKPSEKFFECACTRFGVLKNDTVFIDDLRENVEGAECFGIKGFVFRGNADEAKAFILGFDA